DAITRDAITRGASTRDAITRDAITRGAITRGASTRDAITRDAITRGAITEDAITRGAHHHQRCTMSTSNSPDAITRGAITERAAHHQRPTCCPAGTPARPCSSRCLQELPQRALAAVQRIVEAQLNSAANSTASPRELEATLTLLASCPYDLAKCVRFPDLCQACNILPMLLQVDDESNHQWSLLLKRRAVMLLAAWADVPDALPTELFGAAFSGQSDMSPSRHPLLRLQAARLAHSLLTSLNLDANAFQPHAADCFSGLAGLLAQVRYSVADLRPCLPALVPHLPGMWDSAGGDQARLAVLSVLCELAKLGDLSLGHLALPLAHACLTGPDLFWRAACTCCCTCSAICTPILNRCGFDCFAQSLACLHSRIAERACMEAPERRLLQVCAYLDCDRYLAAHGAALLAACQACLAVPGCCSERRLQPLLLCLIASAVSPQPSAQLLVPLLPGLLSSFCLDVASASSCLAANRVAFWKLVSRVALSQPLLLLAALPSQSSQALPSALLAAWIAACKRSAKLRDLKLLGLGLLAFGFAALVNNNQTDSAGAVELLALNSSLGNEATKRLFESLDAATRTQLMELVGSGTVGACS
uniref:Importin N-terminal domain-containing protein n=1 Tax=Macrostomum lignano TaxID=282301 RepID=A0A1I8ITK1_9PLAT